MVNEKYLQQFSCIDLQIISRMITKSTGLLIVISGKKMEDEMDFAAACEVNNTDVFLYLLTTHIDFRLLLQSLRR